MNSANPEREQRKLWSTTLGVYRWPQAEAANEVLARVFGAMRALQTDGGKPHFFASGDDLLQRITLPEWQTLVRFIVEGLRDTVIAANGGWRDEHGQSPAFNIALEGVWCQISNRGVHHDIHTHGNCSWSGVYCVQVDEDAQRCTHEVFGALNGVTRFYGPHFNQLGGAHMDLGSAYLQQPHQDIAPRPGQLVVFPAWLAHQAMPYEGRQDRIIVSFNASVHAAQGSNQRHGYGRG